MKLNLKLLEHWQENPNYNFINNESNILERDYLNDYDRLTQRLGRSYNNEFIYSLLLTSIKLRNTNVVNSIFNHFKVPGENNMTIEERLCYFHLIINES